MRAPDFRSLEIYRSKRCSSSGKCDGADSSPAANSNSGEGAKGQRIPHFHVPLTIKRDKGQSIRRRAASIAHVSSTILDLERQSQSASSP